MILPKKYLSNKAIFFLLLGNGLLMLLCLLFVLLKVDTNQTAALLSYRATLGLSGYVTGSPSQSYSFALFAVLVTVVSVILSMRLFNFRRLLSVTVLALNVVLLVFTLMVCSALIPVR